MKSSTKSALLAIATVFLWSSAFPITKIAAQAFTPNALGLFRCTLAAGILLGIGCKNRFSKPKKPAHMLLFLLSGGLGFTLYMLFFNTGMLTLNSAVASLIIATTPVLTAAGASVLYHEKIRPAGWCAIAAAFGWNAVDIPKIPEILPGIRLIYNTVPAPILDASLLDKFRNCVKIDLASSPGLDGYDVVYARGLPGQYAPASSGRLIAETIQRYFREGTL